MATNLNLSAPWVTFVHEVQALFGEDPAVNVAFHEDNNILYLFVNGDEKADAITKLLPEEKKFGNVTLKIQVVPANTGKENAEQIFRKAFEGNPVLSYIKTISDGDIFGGACYVVFKKKVIQFFDDNIADVNGNRTTLLQEIAKDVFEDKAGVFFCTDTDE